MVTILCSMNAHGRHIPPFMIFPRKKMNDRLLLGRPPGTAGLPTDSGRTDSGRKDSGWTDSGWTDSGWTDSGWTDSGWTDSGWTDNGWTDSGWTDSGWTDSGWTDSGWTDSGWTDSGRTDSEWTDSTVFIKWLKHFVDHVKPTPSKMVVLFVDGHVSHK